VLCEAESVVQLSCAERTCLSDSRRSDAVGELLGDRLSTG
jgi:hypothetical protein